MRLLLTLVLILLLIPGLAFLLVLLDFLLAGGRKATTIRYVTAQEPF